METAWLCGLEEAERRGSRPRSVLLADGERHDVARRLTDLVGVPDVAVSANDFWMPSGKPVRIGTGWNKEPAKEARLDRDAGFVPIAARQAIRSCLFHVGVRRPHKIIPVHAHCTKRWRDLPCLN